MRKMGGLRQRIPITFWTMTMGVFAISGIPPLAGFFSKDEILYRAFTSDNPLGKLLWFVGLVTAGITSFYMFRLWFKTFFGPEHIAEQTDLHDHGAAVYTHSGSHAVMVADHEESHVHGVHESPWIMLFPLVILAILSFVGLSVSGDMPTWGGLVQEGRLYVNQTPWLLGLPIAAIAITVLACKALGDGLRESLDPLIAK